MKTWVFDLDGTLVDSFGHYYLILEGLIKRSMSEDEKKSVVAQAPVDFLTQQFGLERLQELMAQVYSQGIKDTETIAAYPGAAEFLKSLKESNRDVAVFTNRDLESSSLILKHSGLSPMVDHLVSGTCVTAKKPSPEGLHLIHKKFAGNKEDYVMVGDHDCDMQAAQSFGAHGIRASWHNYWVDSVCDISHKQFFKFDEFTKWSRSHILSIS